MPDHYLLNELFTHGGREKYPAAALNWVLAVPNLIHTYIHTYILTYIFHLLEQVIKAGSNIADVDLLVKPKDNKIDRPK